MTPEAIKALCDAAMRRIIASINKSHGQHLRRMRETWEARQ